MKITIKETKKINHFFELITFLDYYKKKYTFEEMLKQFVLDLMADLYNKSLDGKKIFCGARPIDYEIDVVIVDMVSKVAEEYTLNEYMYNELMNF